MHSGTFFVSFCVKQLSYTARVICDVASFLKLPSLEEHRKFFSICHPICFGVRNLMKTAPTISIVLWMKVGKLTTTSGSIVDERHYWKTMLLDHFFHLLPLLAWNYDCVEKAVARRRWEKVDHHHQCFSTAKPKTNHAIITHDYFTVLWNVHKLPSFAAVEVISW